MPMYPATIEVMAPRTNEAVVKAPSVKSWPTPTRKKTTAPKTTMNMQQMVYSADKKASAPRRIAS